MSKIVFEYPSATLAEGRVGAFRAIPGDYVKIAGARIGVILDIKEVFTAPARWDTRDWMVLGGVAAGIGTVAAFDKDIERAIRGARNNTVTNIFDNVQPFGNEYAIGIVGSFYIYGELFKDPRAKTTALDSIAASAIASGIVTNSFKYVIGAHDGSIRSRECHFGTLRFALGPGSSLRACFRSWIRAPKQ